MNRRLRPYAVELEFLAGKVLVEQRTACHLARSADEAVAMARRAHAQHPLRMRVVGIDVDPEPDADASCGASPLEPLPTLGARAG